MPDSGGADDNLREEVAEFLARGKRAARNGSKPQAYAYFRKINQIDRSNEEAWLWRAGVVDDPAESKACLEELLSINPAHERAQTGLTWLREQHPELFVEPTSPPATTMVEASPATVNSPPRPRHLPRAAATTDAKLALVRCLQCGKKNFPEDGVCLRCGTPLEPLTETASTGGNQTSSRAAPSSHVVRTILLILLIIAVVALGAVLYFTNTLL